MARTKTTLLAVYSQTARDAQLRRDPNGKPIDIIVTAQGDVEPATAFFNIETGASQLNAYRQTYPDMMMLNGLQHENTVICTSLNARYQKVPKTNDIAARDTLREKGTAFVAAHHDITASLPFIKPTTQVFDGYAVAGHGGPAIFLPD